MSSFVAVDVETANAGRFSICQIGLVAFENGNIQWEWGTLINPECDFDSASVGIHKINSSSVREAPTWPMVLATINQSIANQILVSHSGFDCDALHQASKRYSIELPNCRWLDALAVSKSAWPSLPHYDLKTLCERFQIELQHHDALSDARACGAVFLQAMRDTGIDLTAWIAEVGLTRPSSYSHEARTVQIRYPERISQDGNPDGPLIGHEWVCTGKFTTQRQTLATLAASLGCNVRDRVSKATTILVVGQQDPSSAKSKKLSDAEAAVAAGRKIHILVEREFVELANYYSNKHSQ